MPAGQAASATQFKQYCSSCSPSISGYSFLSLGAIATGDTSTTVCMDTFLILSAGAAFDGVHRNGYLGSRSHGGARDYTGIS